MKKQLTAVLLIFGLLLTMAGCSAANAVAHRDAAEERVEEKMDRIEESVEQAVHRAALPAENTGSTITKAQAENIALEYAGFSAEQVSRLRTEYEIDDRTPQYDVSFCEGDWEYEFEISAEDGRILSFDKDHKYD